MGKFILMQFSKTVKSEKMFLTVQNFECRRLKISFLKSYNQKKKRFFAKIFSMTKSKQTVSSDSAKNFIPQDSNTESGTVVYWAITDMKW